jgi:hypothetical protein
LGVKAEPENHQTRGLGDTGENLKHGTRNLEPQLQVGVGVIPDTADAVSRNPACRGEADSEDGPATAKLIAKTGGTIIRSDGSGDWTPDPSIKAFEGRLG